MFRSVSSVLAAAARSGHGCTHPVALAVVVACVRVEGAQMHPAKTHFILGIVEEATDVGSGLQRRSSLLAC